MIKFQLGRLILPDDPETHLMEQIQRNSFQPLPTRMSHSLHLLAVPPLHRDPFDQILIAQAQFENLPLLTGAPDGQVIPRVHV